MKTSDAATARRGPARDKIVRHALPDRVYHWLMAASVLTLLFTAFLPIVGVKFAWVTIHWIAGLVLTAAILYHMVRALIWQDRGAMWVGRRDLRDAWRSTRLILTRSADPPPKPGKYPLLQKLYHHAAAALVLVTVVTGLAMLSKIDTPFWRRDPYWLSDQTWGVIYVLHGVASLCLISLIMVHIYFAVRPEKFWVNRSMILGWVTRKDYLDHHDPQRWAVPEGAGRAGRPSRTKAPPPKASTES